MGDELLAAIARRLEATQRAGDTVARLGGDEFVILLDNLHDAGDAMQIAARIQQEMAIPFELGTREVFTSASIGIVLNTADYQQPEEVLRDADIALYRAKALGRGQYQIFDMEMHARAMERMEMETDLRRVLERGELRLYYQPIMSLEDGRITGFEALMRWHHPQRGVVPPSLFVSVAEETGLIVPMGFWALREACRQLCVWQDRFPSHPPLSVSVNLSGKNWCREIWSSRLTLLLLRAG